MDESAFRHAKGEINRLPCVFERPLLAQHAVCEFAVRRQIAERETIACAHPVTRAMCARLYGLLGEKSAFALKLTDPQQLLTHAMVMKIQCGGLDGLKHVLDPEAVAPDVRHLLQLAQEQFDDLEALPFSEVVQGVAAWKPRRRFPR
jgi:hypothetical protein